jgi:S1-C subfamily serine protease
VLLVLLLWRFCRCHPLKRGVQPGDVVMSLNHRRVKSAQSFLNNIAQRSPGSRVKLTYFRKNKKQDIELVVGRRP